VRDLICAVEKVHPRLGAEIVGPDGKFTGLVHVYVEGRNVEWLQGMDTVIRPGDELFLIPPVAGG
jgi:molybdopterin converting factor small subunit